MEIKQYYLTNNSCYSNPKIIKPIGFMLHSTGANNPNLKRYIQPDDGIIGYNEYQNDWNRPFPQVDTMVHGFIGKDDFGIVRAYQILPYDYKAWHCGGSGNNTHVSWEMCEDDLTDKSYFNSTYSIAVEVATDFCKQYNYDETCIVDHSEGNKLGIASNHGDVKHWFSRFGKTMDDFREDVRKNLEGEDMTKDEVKQIVKEMLEEMKEMQVSAWAKPIIERAMEKGITDGTKPRAYAERQEVVAMVMNMYDEIIKKLDKKLK